MGVQTTNLWKAVKIAKNLNNENIPDNLTLNDIPIAPGTSAECFARHFSEKIKSTSSKCKIGGECTMANASSLLIAQFHD